jgi:hypothetical protein
MGVGSAFLMSESRLFRITPESRAIVEVTKQKTTGIDIIGAISGFFDGLLTAKKPRLSRSILRDRS